MAGDMREKLKRDDRADQLKAAADFVSSNFGMDGLDVADELRQLAGREQVLGMVPADSPDAEVTVEMVDLTHEVKRWCSGDDDWSNWQPCTAEKAAEYAKDDSVKVRRRITPQPKTNPGNTNS